MSKKELGRLYGTLARILAPWMLVSEALAEISLGFIKKDLDKVVSHALGIPKGQLIPVLRVKPYIDTLL